MINALYYIENLLEVYLSLRCLIGRKIEHVLRIIICFRICVYIQYNCDKLLVLFIFVSNYFGNYG